MRKILFLILPLIAAVISPVPANATVIRAAKPNVMMIYVDDMTLSDLAYMDFTRNLFLNEGVTFANGISPHPLCCPARRELMTGQYAQNNGVYHNAGPFGGNEAAEAAGTARQTTQWFNEDGYNTAYVGKYLNGYKGGNIPGTDVTEAFSKGVYKPYDFTSWNNGDEQVRGKHTTVWTGDRTLDLIEGWNRSTPFMTISAFLAPHSMVKDGEWVPPYARALPKSEPLTIPPSKYKTVEPGDERPASFDKPSFNEADMTDKPSVMPRTMVDPDGQATQHKARVLSLYAVDDQIQRMVNRLKAIGEYGNTVIAFTSDNGYLLGEHRDNGKDRPYYEALRVPIMFTGPGVPNEVRQAPVTTIDIPVTLAALAGVQPNRTVDGINALNATPERKVLIQSGSNIERFDWRGIFTPRYTYVEHSTGEKEFYDRNTDPFEIESNPADPQADVMAGWLDQMRTCRGVTCLMQ